MGVTIGSLVNRFYESTRFCTYATDFLENCSRFPVVVQVNGKLHRVKRVAVGHGAMVLVAADAEYKEINHEQNIRD